MKKYEDKTIDVRESELAGREVTITEGKGLKIQRGQTKLQNETDIILDQNKGNTKKESTSKVINADDLSNKKKEELAIKKKNNPFADVGYE